MEETHVCDYDGHTWTRPATKGQRPKRCPEHRNKVRTACVVCGVEVTKTRAQVYAHRPTCADACRVVVTYGDRYPSREGFAKAQRPARSAAAPSLPILVTFACEGCGETVTMRRGGGRLRKTCSPSCSKRHQRKARRAKVREAYVEPVTWLTLYKSNGPRCHYCGEDTDPADYTEKPGSDGRPAVVVGPRFPTHDHVRALANEGAHSRENAVLACFACNWTKGAAL